MEKEEVVVVGGGRGLVQFRCRHSDRVWTQTDSSSWQLRGSFFGFYSTKAERDLKCSLRRDQAESRFGLKPHKHKLAENKVTAEKQPVFKASSIPLWSQQKWKLYFWHCDWKFFSNKKVTLWLFMDSQRLWMLFLYSASVILEASRA